MFKSKKKVYSYWGKAKIQRGDVLGVQLIYKAPGEDGEHKKGFRLPLDKAPGYVQNGIWSVKVKTDFSEIQSATPYNAKILCKYAGMSHKEGEEPKPLTKQGEWGNYEVFTLLYECVEEKLLGLVVSHQQPYNFTFSDLDNDGNQWVRYSKQWDKSPPTRELDHNLDVLGNNQERELPYKDNILPMLDRIFEKCAKEGVTFYVYIKDGFVEKLEPLSPWDEVKEGETGEFEDVPFEVDMVSPEFAEEDISTPVVAEKPKKKKKFTPEREKEIMNDLGFDEEKETEGEEEFDFDD